MVVGIGGCSNAGKSALAIQIANKFVNLNSIIICQDDFVKFHNNLTKIESHIDWEIPTTIMIDKYIAKVKETSKIYDLVIAEGLFAFWFDDLNNLYDRKIYLDISKNTFISRKTKDLRWGKEPTWYVNHIWKSHQLYGMPCERDFEVKILDANEEIDIENLMKFLDIVLSVVNNR
ncbi:MAG: hypothetical protein AUJ98_02825 [Bacteroidetes bacterium CG2_30_33_31]|nr:MAG: hypothetical protein AUJ98_02825 [Bacteroidetes bacterium CG2_30_33_31]